MRSRMLSFGAVHENVAGTPDFLFGMGDCTLLVPE